MQHTVHEFNGHTVIKIKNNIDIFNASEFKKMMFDIISEEHSSIIVDMQEIGFTDSSAVSVIIACKRRADLYNCKFGLVNVTDNFIDILHLATLDKFFTIYEDYESLPQTA